MAHTKPNSPTVEVAAAVMLRHIAGQPVRSDTPRQALEFLLACRPAGKVYAGYWEFPGGKVESGETVKAALVRELNEEMGICVTEARPWLHKQFHYPHATVHLNFWQVTAWNGEAGGVAPLEHSALHWLPLAKALAAGQCLSPILPANGPILKGLALPCRMFITQAEHIGVPAELARIAKAAERDGSDAMLQIRDQGLAPQQRRDFAAAAVALAKAAGMVVVLNVRDQTQMDWAAGLGVDGLHLTSRALAQCVTRPDGLWVGASCHQAEELAKAADLALDYAVLGPVQQTLSHPDASPLGWGGFAERIRDNRLPVFALGGLGLADLEQAHSVGAHGLALMRGW